MRHEALRKHRVPLRRRPVEFLDEAPMLGGGSALVLPAVTTLRKMLQHQRIPAVAHRLRWRL